VTGPVEESAASVPDDPKPPRSGAAAAAVFTGILISRLFGIVRQTLMASFLGTTAVADAFNASFKITNILQNLFGEGALSASFVPVYRALLKRGDQTEADRVAGAVAALLGLTVTVLVLVGIVATPVLIPLIASGFRGEKRELTIQLTRILWPGAGIFVLGAWCLGVLNSHRKFWLPYLAPVLWNVVMIGVLFWAGPRQGERDLVVTLAWASVGGALLQFLVQVPTTVSLVKQLRLSPSLQSPHVRVIARNFGPVFIARGAVQISSYIDNWIATFLPHGMVATVGYATTISILPVSLFGMSVSAAELTEISGVTGEKAEVAAFLRGRLEPALRKIAYFVVPSAMALAVLGEAMSAVLFEHRKFTPTDSLYAWGILAGSSIGLLATTMARLYSSTYYALHDTKSPLRFALVRIGMTLIVGYVAALYVPGLLGIDPRWGAALLTASSSVAGWVEFSLLRSRLNARIGKTGVPARFLLQLWAAAGAAGVAGWMMWQLAGPQRFLGGAAALVIFGVVYLLATVALNIREAHALVARVRRVLVRSDR
jgi:putative peptidoglycan lipid II flippase